MGPTDLEQKWSFSGWGYSNLFTGIGGKRWGLSPLEKLSIIFEQGQHKPITKAERQKRNAHRRQVLRQKRYLRRRR